MSGSGWPGQGDTGAAISVWTVCFSSFNSALTATADGCSVKANGPWGKNTSFVTMKKTRPPPRPCSVFHLKSTRRMVGADLTSDYLVSVQKLISPKSSTVEMIIEVTLAI